MLATNPFMIVLRFLHIVAGVLWVGSAFLFVAIIGPSAAEVGPSAGPLLSVAVHKRKVVKVIEGLGGVTVLAGWTMWIRDAKDLHGVGNWVGTPLGLGITIGALFASAAFFVGSFGVGRNVERLVALGERMAAGDGPPTSEQVAEMGRLQKTLEVMGKTDLLLMLIAVGCMATAQYW
jgi:hypothetical protein